MNAELNTTTPYECVVAMLTYRRPEDLREAIPPLLEQIGQCPRARLLIIDNEPEAGQAERIVAEFARTAGAGAVEYLHEPTPGISAARNAALEAAAGADVLVFIDDDERPEADWLASLLDCYRRYGEPAAVAGVVVSHFEGELEPYIEAGGFFRRGNPPTGTLRPAAATNNLLLDLRVLQRHGLRFDPAFGISGGSDSLLTKQLVGLGERIVWCREAVVVDRVPASRMTRDWVLQKQYRLGNTTARVELQLARASRRPVLRAQLFARGAARVAVGSAMRAVGLATRRLDLAAGGHRLVTRGAGLAAGAAGRVYSEYSRD